MSGKSADTERNVIGLLYRCRLAGSCLLHSITRIVYLSVMLFHEALVLQDVKFEQSDDYGHKCDDRLAVESAGRRDSSVKECKKLVWRSYHDSFYSGGEFW